MKDEIKKIAEELAGTHYHVEEDTWYCCGLCDDCANDQRKGKCDCGLQGRIDKIEQALRDYGESVARNCRESVAKFLIAHNYATGHGDTIEDLLNELLRQVKEQVAHDCAEISRKYLLKENCPKCKLELEFRGLEIATAIKEKYNL